MNDFIGMVGEVSRRKQLKQMIDDYDIVLCNRFRMKLGLIIPEIAKMLEVSYAQFAERLGFPKSSVYQWRHMQNLMEPVAATHLLDYLKQHKINGILEVYKRSLMIRERIHNLSDAKEAEK